MKHQFFRLIAVTILGMLLILSIGIAHAQEQVTVTLNPSPGQTASGTATLTAVGPSTTSISVTATGLSPNTTISNHFHSGTCASPGEAPFVLSNLVTNAQGNASATTTLNVPLSSLSGLLILAPHVQVGGTPIICGTVPAVAAATPVPAAATPAATPVAAAATPVATVVAGAAALPSAGGIPLPLIPAALLGGAATALGIALRLRRH